ncbi:outer membrane beta-barrel family protein [Solitalea koreensis]|uniref:Outer membrane receptor proteins, mostly Fe transport n=1 Tax=Solitalea koreensis TaxID=543615 RepID=A0A521AAV4_9SPHI|nr:outer membrane beta-barrel family protein [Solitalea koreensis]SMO31928.1 Outer membrane receptor proteins, mostly Fe transport [Solitalea koreensis]
MKFLPSISLLVSVWVFFSPGANAQSLTRGSVTGKIKEAKKHEVLEGAVISVMSKQDSSLRGVLSDKYGMFSIKNLPVGNYKLFCSYFGYKDVIRHFFISKEKPECQLDDILLDSALITLNEITVIAEVPPVVIKKDTTEFNANSYKTKTQAVVEDLLKQLPGVEVEKDGSISAQGQKITAVLVDGKPFFGNDPKLATQNLPANIINKVQVITVDPEKAEHGESGIIINLSVRKDKKKGGFGNVSLGAGSNNRYKGNLSLNRFNNEQQFSIISNANNVSSDVGISNSFSGGINFNNPLNNKLVLSLSYLNNLNNTNQSSFLKRNTLLQNESLLYSDRSTNSNNSQRHAFDLTLDYKINSSTNLNFNSKISYRQFSSSSSSLFESSSPEGNVNDGNRSTKSSTKSPDFNNNIKYAKRFIKKGRQLSLSIKNSYESNDQIGFNYSLSNYYQSQSVNQSLINQQNSSDRSKFSNDINLMYSEPLFTNHLLKFNYAFNNGIENSTRNANDFDELSKEYDLPNAFMSNVYRNRTNANRIGTSFNENGDTYDYSVGISIQETDLKGHSIAKDSIYTQNNFSVLPQASFNYKISKNSRISTNYRGDIRQPSILDLQPTPDNTNPLYIKIGNPDLQSEFNNNLSVNYSKFDPISNWSMFANLSVGTTFNKITYNSFIDAAVGKQTSKPENVSGNYNLNLNVSWGIPIKSVRTKPGLNTSIIKNTTYINGIKSTSYNSRCGLTYAVNYKYANKLDFNMNYTGNFNNVQYENPGLKDASYLNLTSTIGVTYYLPKNFAVNSDLTYFRNENQIQVAKKSIALLNASIYKEFLNNKARLTLDAYDLLKQNTSINRTITDNQIEDRQSNNITQYFMLTFTYRFNKFNSSASNDL